MDELNNPAPAAAEEAAVSVPAESAPQEEAATEPAASTQEPDLDSIIEKNWEKIQSHKRYQEDVTHRVNSTRQSDLQRWQAERDADIRAQQQREWEDAILNTPDDDLDKLVDLGKFTKAQIATIRQARAKEESATQQAQYIATEYWKTVSGQLLDSLTEDERREVKLHGENGSRTLKEIIADRDKILVQREAQKMAEKIAAGMEESITKKVLATVRGEDESPIISAGMPSTDDDTFIKQYGLGKVHDSARARKLLGL